MPGAGTKLQQHRNANNYVLQNNLRQYSCPCWPLGNNNTHTSWEGPTTGQIMQGANTR
jgi:hypothetical protein